MRSLRYKYIAIDFDGTIASEQEESYPLVGELLPYAKETIEELVELGAVITVWTCREELGMDLCLDFLASNNIPYHFVNENNPDKIAIWKNDTRKIGADLYIDDKALKAVGKEVDWLEIRKNIIIE
ncbi:HAD-like domain containing protein [Listeria phage LP-125]|uniref:HAD-like domain containing protein n=6 Tax=Pecentumvirus TaxID=1857844 RepID=S4U821_9CAUD|nr:HAD-like domain containing protein [Listeria phage LP-125]YP_009044517.1 phosphoheptose isomerase [Listeria phage LP-083-2]YP_009592594.1 phosphoheptose isomerase [Listeria phage LP-064]YP_009784682.1 HAD-like domain-containing protein [Listeria phage LP-124]QDK04893.2 hypothetical protein FK486_0046 [Listeria phage LP-066]QNL32009.1 hypothetical protein HUK30_0047 [Listeria phage LP-Mix_6.2]AGI11384.1 HAD-like domain containing protein [Listeria phage LP-125]AHL19085.1 HAD-like domain-co